MRLLNFALSGLLGLTGCALVWWGAELLLAGGSAYYLPAGIALLECARLTWRQSSRVIPLFGTIWLVTLLWSFWESGLDGWALAPRMAMFSVIGLWMMTPSFRRSLGLAPKSLLIGTTYLMVAAGILGLLGWTFWNDRLPVNDATQIQAEGPIHPADGEWRHFGNSQSGERFSPLSQINVSNVAALRPAWTFHTGPLPAGARSSFQATPLMIGDKLFFCTGYNDVIALDAESGRQIWRYKAQINRDGVFGLTCRGVSYFAVPGANAGGDCAERIYTATLDARLIALDAKTGKACVDFGENGQVNLLEGMGAVEKGYYFVTSPPAVVRGQLVLGGWVIDGQHVGEPSGVIRAYDAVSGHFSWAFDSGHPDRHTLPPASESFTRGTPNSWTPMSADESLGLVYVPTGNATPDYFGGHRSALMEKYSSSVIALDASTGSVRWSFQTTHHDLWDYDVGSQPTLVTLKDGRPALLQPTKRGEIFMLDRRTGQPIATVTERKVPVGAVPGERYARTQPFSTGLPSFSGMPPSESRMWGLTPIDQLFCRVLFRRARFAGTMTPLSLDRPAITWPGYLGGIDWGGVSVDARSGIMIVNSTHVANYNQLMSRKDADAMGLKPMTARKMGDVGGPAPQTGTPYAARVRPFLSPLAIPCQQPPYGLISAVDINTGKKLWEQSFGTSRDSGPLMTRTALPIPMGVPNLGGSVITGSGIVFIGATQEHMLRAYDIRSGKELWRSRLPAGGQAGPMTYWSAKSGRQFVVIAAGGHGAMLSGYSDELRAFALPRR